MVRYHWSSLLLGLCLLSLGSACNLDDEDLNGSSQCDDNGAASMVGGTWRLSGHGKREGCTDERFNTDRFDMKSEQLVVAQNGNALVLQSIPTSSTTFAFSEGHVQGSCIFFRITESTAVGPIALDFEGEITYDGNITGDFEGTGPEGCSASGTFRVEVTCCAGTGPDTPTPDSDASGDSVSSETGADTGSASTDSQEDEKDESSKNSLGCAFKATAASKHNSMWVLAVIMAGLFAVLRMSARKPFSKRPGHLSR